MDEKNYVDIPSNVRTYTCQHSLFHIPKPLYLEKFLPPDLPTCVTATHEPTNVDTGIKLRAWGVELRGDRRLL